MAARKFDASNLSPKEAYETYVKQERECRKANRIKKAIREEYLPIVEDNRNSFVIGKNEDGVEFGFQLDVRKTFSKKEYENLLLKEFGKKMTERVLDLFDSAKTGLSRSFSTF